MKGHTLLELVVVIALVAVVAVLAVPNLNNWIPHLKLYNAAGALISDLRLVREYAISQNRQFKVVFNDDSEQYLIQKGNAFFGSDVWTTVEAIRDYSNPLSLYYLIDLYSAANDIIFNPDGSVSSSLTVELRDKNEQRYQIKIENLSTGFVESFRWDGSQWK